MYVYVFNLYVVVQEHRIFNLGINGTNPNIAAAAASYSSVDNVYAPKSAGINSIRKNTHLHAIF